MKTTHVVAKKKNGEIQDTWFQKYTWLTRSRTNGKIRCKICEADLNIKASGYFCRIAPHQIFLPGTTVISDMWRAYDCLGERGYQHLRVNHSINFVDPHTGATTNHVERMWKEAKQRNKRENGTHRHMLGSYLIEFMWRQQFGDSPFENIIEQISRMYIV